MGRPSPASEGGLVDYALNRANARLAIFDGPDDYDAFLRVLTEAVAARPMRLLSFCAMPDHFHLMPWPHADGDLWRFMRRRTLTRTRRRHAHRRSAGAGHLHRGLFKSLPVEGDDHLLVAYRYVGRDALRAGLVGRAESWRWGSLARLDSGTPAASGPPLSPWPIARPAGWVARVNAALGPVEEESLRRSIRRGQPFVSPEWQATTARRLGLKSAFRPQSRPRSRKTIPDSLYFPNTFNVQINVARSKKTKLLFRP